ncbi:hypothetical protein LshimejAT787_2200670 [Lyophyllum shimeji]|uniref:Uncharacterized protein n=1 Tax=Lyophyllum shimeji TaxID=47721 RepID=A0A9P3Q1L3_LYOSH|nr:hypothetical protein LshimejAT787_2200670 [Lyophyllum shimeji]
MPRVAACQVNPQPPSDPRFHRQPRCVGAETPGEAYYARRGAADTWTLKDLPPGAVAAFPDHVVRLGPGKHLIPALRGVRCPHAQAPRAVRVRTDLSVVRGRGSVWSPGAYRRHEVRNGGGGETIHGRRTCGREVDSSAVMNANAGGARSGAEGGAAAVLLVPGLSRTRGGWGTQEALPGPETLLTRPSRWVLASVRPPYRFTANTCTVPLLVSTDAHLPSRVHCPASTTVLVQPLRRYATPIPRPHCHRRQGC